ncbi:hypothetical protein AAVH_30117 [Aphelenchoides avenae]|nr:hypothetical protein AAVH_30117 [Aphelenchus avenae]
MHRDLHLEAIRWLDRRSLTVLLLTNASLKQWTETAPPLTNGHVDEHRIALEKASLTRANDGNREVYTLHFLGGNGEPAVDYVYPNLKAAAEQFAFLIKSAYLMMLEISADCAGDSRLSLPGVLTATDSLQNTVVEHLRIVSSSDDLPTFDFRVSAYHRLVTGVFREVHAISFDGGGWHDFDWDDDMESELPVVNAFFGSVLDRGITSIDFSYFDFTVPWGPPGSVFDFCLQPMAGQGEHRDRFVALQSFPGLTAESSEAFVNDVIKANAAGTLLHNFELRIRMWMDPWPFFRHPQLQEAPNDESSRVIAFSDHSRLELKHSVDAGAATLTIKYRSTGSNTP